MAFTVSDFNDLLRLLEEHPDWRAELRRILLGPEILELPATVARLAAVVEQLVEEVRHLTERMDAVEGRLERLEAGQQRLEAGQQRLEARQQELEAGQRQIRGELDQLVGSDRERKFRDLALSTFGRWLRGLRAVEKHELDDLFGDVLDRDQFLDLIRADAFFRGRLGSGVDRPFLWLVAEVSRVVDRQDVARAARRAAVLRQAGVAAVGVAAGESSTEGATALAAQEKVAVQEDGRVTGWDEALASAGLSG